MKQGKLSPLPDIICACASTRRAARLVTQLYGSEMGQDIEPTQYSLLFFLDKFPGSTQTAMGNALALDKTTLSRSLRLLARNGWVAPVHSADQRERGHCLTAKGKERLAASTDGWRRAQQKLRSALPPGEWEKVMNAFGLVANAARDVLLESENQEI